LPRTVRVAGSPAGAEYWCDALGNDLEKRARARCGADIAIGGQIRTAPWADEKRIGASIGRAFAADPYVRWLLPDPCNYLKANEKYVRLSSGPSFDNGSAFVIGDISGAGLCLSPGTKVDSGPLAEEAEKYFGPAVHADFAGLMEAADGHRPSRLHWYLTLIAVDPAKSGRGLGAALMAHGLRMCDRDDLPAYPESKNAANLSLFKRFRFELLAEVGAGKSVDPASAIRCFATPCNNG